MVNKVFVLIGDYIGSFANTNYFELRHGDTVIFTHEQVYNELESNYSYWSYLAKQFEEYQGKFISLYNQYVANMGEAYWRMYDALTREYNPINNYDMVESGIDGRKQSKKTTADGGTNTQGEKYGSSDSTKSGSQNLQHGHSITDTQTGNIVTDRYENAFDSGISSDGTHVSKEVVQPPTQRQQNNSGTDTTSYNNVKDTITHSHDVADTQTGGIGSGWDAVKTEKRDTEQTEQYANDVSLTFKKSTPDGSENTVNAGNDFSEGTMHSLTRSGNIGVTTSAQMIQGEIELRKLNLLSQWVEGFIREYCTFTGVDE